MLITIQMNRTAILQMVRKSDLKEDNIDRNGVRNEHGRIDLKASLSGGMVWDSNASLKQVRANARISVV